MGFIKTSKSDAQKQPKLPKQPKAPKKPKQPKEKKAKSGFKISIRTKLIVAFLVPVLLIIVLGYTSYTQAKKALIENYEGSTESIVNVTSGYYDIIISSLSSVAYETVVDSTTKSFYTGAYESSLADKWSASSSIKSNLTASVMSNSYLKSITIIPEKFGEVMSTESGVSSDLYSKINASDVVADLDKTKFKWVGFHTDIDEGMKTAPKFYAMSQIRLLYNTYLKKAGYIVFDVDYEHFKEALSSTELCAGSIIALKTPDGRELSTMVMAKGEKENPDKVDNYLGGYNFAQNLSGAGSKYVDFNGAKYLMVYHELENDGFMLMALVPEKAILADANAILQSTILLVVISCVLAVIIGTIISGGFSKAMKAMMNGLSKAAQGDLTVNIKTKRNDEFKTLSESINSMLSNVRDLLVKANSVTEVVDAASEEVSSNADVMLNSTVEIKNSISEIDSGIVGQAEDAEKCLHQMDALSSQIEGVAKSAGNIAVISDKTRGIVSSGISTIDELKQKSDDTKEVTDSVIKCIEELNESSASIEEIIEVINSIASQTSLLSLNASIEAARAGDAGRGFSVVAQEIRKLADQSMDSVAKIQAIVNTIREQTNRTVTKARESSDIVNSQEETLKKTVEMFTSIDEHVAGLTGDLDSILCEIKTIEDAKRETLGAIESISAISEETAAVTSTVQDSAESQLQAAETLASAAKALRTDSEELSAAIHMFTI
ncbi:MAG: methyl-accepting chemotaxis protein [Lachnospiraceae bacterium]|nr:methyl-accepting chemotaxis protein [Lachnospiraceae bacterium]